MVFSQFDIAGGMKICDPPAQVCTALDLTICKLQLWVNRAYFGWMKLF